jgi:hypothetical protein
VLVGGSVDQLGRDADAASGLPDAPLEHGARRACGDRHPEPPSGTETGVRGDRTADAGENAQISPAIPSENIADPLGGQIREWAAIEAAGAGLSASPRPIHLRVEMRRMRLRPPGTIVC